MLLRRLDSPSPPGWLATPLPTEHCSEGGGPGEGVRVREGGREGGWEGEREGKGGGGGRGGRS